MSKKPSSTTPKPKLPTDEQVKRLSVDLPERVHTRFKTACSATGRKMAGELQDFIERRTHEMEKEAGITRK